MTAAVPSPRTRLALVLAAAAPLLIMAGCSSSDGNSTPTNAKPSYVTIASSAQYAAGANDHDLLTAGLGASGIASTTAPTYADPAAPTALELRRAAIYNNYRAIVDTTAAGGYGVLYGPGLDASGTPITGDNREGKIAGIEVLGYADDGSGRQNVTLMVQVPAGFSTALPCIVTATSSGSRGVYGGIAVGEWGLKRGCAVAYTDKGTGAAPHDLQGDTVALIDGRRVTAAAARAQAAASGVGGTLAQFDAGLSAADLAAFNAATPNRLAFKHAHSQQNPEKDWGRHTLQAIEFAFYVINESYGAQLVGGGRGRSFTPSNTLVIASAVSNGGGAAIAAAEQDDGGLIDGVAVGEPQIQLPASPAVTVQRGGATVAASAKSLYDYTSYANLYEACASQATSLAGAPLRTLVNPALAAARCASLDGKALLAGETSSAELAEKARLKLLRYGWEAESEPLYAVLGGSEVASAIAVTYADSYSRSSVKDNLCGYSFAAVNAAFAPTAIAPAALATMFSAGNGVPPSAGVQIVNNASPGGALRDLVSISPSTGTQDLNLDGALCLRNLLTGSDAKSLALQTGVAETKRSGNLRGKPAVIVHGRADALVPVNHSSRPYLALNKTVEGAASRLSYLEVTNAQHFDAFLPFAGYDTRYVPLHVYLIRALDAVYANLRTGAALPPSQVVRTVPRGGTAGAAPAITAANVPAPASAAALAAGDAIAVSGSTVNVPN